MARRPGFEPGAAVRPPASRLATWINRGGEQYQAPQDPLCQYRGPLPLRPPVTAIEVRRASFLGPPCGLRALGQLILAPFPRGWSRCLLGLNCPSSVRPRNPFPLEGADRDGGGASRLVRWLLAGFDPPPDPLPGGRNWGSGPPPGRRNRWPVPPYTSSLRRVGPISLVEDLTLAVGAEGRE